MRPGAETFYFFKANGERFTFHVEPTLGQGTLRLETYCRITRTWVRAEEFAAGYSTREKENTYVYVTRQSRMIRRLTCVLGFSLILLAIYWSVP